LKHGRFPVTVPLTVTTDLADRLPSGRINDAVALDAENVPRRTLREVMTWAIILWILSFAPKLLPMMYTIFENDRLAFKRVSDR
jgi:hypothetical protein